MKQRILAVDDEPHMLRLLERLITEKTDYEITTTSNSLKVPEILAGQSFDLIITDLRMPGKDGMDLLRYVTKSGRDELVLMITAFGTLESASEALAEGAFDYMTKPFRQDDFLNTVNRAMKWQHCRREAARWHDLFDREPFASAAAAFEEEYIRRLAERCGRDPEALAARSGLPADVIRKVLDADKNLGKTSD